MSKDLENKVAIITGASSGIGQETAIYFSNLGAKVVLVARNEEKLNETIEKCQKGNAIKVVGDINDFSLHEKIVQAALKTYGKIDILVNNAGIVTTDSVFNIEAEKFDSIFNTNLKSVIFLTKACVPHLVEQKGAIVNVSSLFGRNSQSNYLSYSISKAALDQFTKCISLELAPKQVRVNSVNPGHIRTNIAFINGIAKTKEEDDKFWESNGSKYPIGRIGKTDEVASVIAFLASDKSSFITGELIIIDGGKHLAYFE